jgi:hypothetical protein
VELPQTPVPDIKPRQSVVSDLCQESPVEYRLPQVT